MNNWRIVFLITILLSPITVQGYQYDIQYKGLDDSTHSFSEYSGSYLLIEAMTSVCDSCKDQIPFLKEVRDSTGDDLKILALSIDKTIDNSQTLKDYKENHDITWEMGLDYYGFFSQNFQITETPTIILLNPQGELLKVWEGLTTSKVITDELSNYMEVDYHGQNPISILVDNLFSNYFFILFVLILFLIAFSIGIKRANHYIQSKNTTV